MAPLCRVVFGPRHSDGSRATKHLCFTGNLQVNPPHRKAPPTGHKSAKFGRLSREAAIEAYMDAMLFLKEFLKKIRLAWNS